MVNHRFPSGPAVIADAALIPGSVKDVSTPAGVKRTIEPLCWVTHTFPSGPVVIADGEPPPLEKYVTVPSVVIRPTEAPMKPSLALYSPPLRNHMLPSGPAVMRDGWSL